MQAPESKGVATAPPIRARGGASCLRPGPDGRVDNWMSSQSEPAEGRRVSDPRPDRTVFGIDRQSEPAEGRRVSDVTLMGLANSIYAQSEPAEGRRVSEQRVTAHPTSGGASISARGGASCLRADPSVESHGGSNDQSRRSGVVSPRSRQSSTSLCACPAIRAGGAAWFLRVVEVEERSVFVTARARGGASCLRDQLFTMAYGAATTISARGGASCLRGFSSSVYGVPYYVRQSPRRGVVLSETRMRAPSDAAFDPAEPAEGRRVSESTPMARRSPAGCSRQSPRRGVVSPGRNMRTSRLSSESRQRPRRGVVSPRRWRGSFRISGWGPSAPAERRRVSGHMRHIATFPDGGAIRAGGAARSLRGDVVLRHQRPRSGVVPPTTPDWPAEAHGEASYLRAALFPSVPAEWRCDSDHGQIAPERPRSGIVAPRKMRELSAHGEASCLRRASPF